METSKIIKSVSVILKRRRDTGLIRIYLTLGNVEFNKLVRDSLRVLTRPGYIPQVVIPAVDELAEIPESYDDFPKTIRIQLQLRSQDKDLADLLDNVDHGSVGSFIRDALSFYVGPTFMFNTKLTGATLDTVPFYTPNGVIVFSSSAPSFAAPVSREQKQQRIVEINAAIAKKETKRKEKPVAPVSVPNIEPVPTLSVEEAPVSLDTQLEPITTPQAVEPTPAPAPTAPVEAPVEVSQPAPQNIPDSSAVFAASEFGFEEQSVADSGDEDDVLALLEGLM